MSAPGWTKGPWELSSLTIYALQPHGWKRGVEQFSNRFSMSVQGGVDWEGAPTPSNELFAIARLAKAAPELAEALELAERFIINGVELGYIRLPSAGDPALNTLPTIQAALAKARGHQ